MTSAVDTNILLDILLPDPKFLESSTRLLNDAIATGKVIISEVVYAELSAQFGSKEELESFLEDSSIVVQPANQAAMWEAGRAWMRYLKARGEEIECPQCGDKRVTRCEKCGEIIAGRQHIVSDFLIGGHAQMMADTLLTRDRGFYQTYFKSLPLNKVAPARKRPQTEHE